eukprot:m.142084 g.142084  ORF g.142084 m.142084 type:complete len:325 (-) comp30231_c3_seq1:234-1208(-)
MFGLRYVRVMVSSLVNSPTRIVSRTAVHNTKPNGTNTLVQIVVGASVASILAFVSVLRTSSGSTSSKNSSIAISPANAKDDPRAARCLELQMLTPEQAQRTQIVKIPGFLSIEETNSLVDHLNDIKTHKLCGNVTRSGDGEQQLDGLGCWTTTYMHTNHVFQQEFPQLRERIMKLGLAVDAANWQQMIGKEDNVAIRTVEYHEYSPGGRLEDNLHCDIGSFVTIDIMLADPQTDFEGGEFYTPEGDGTQQVHVFNKGDAVLFCSHKYHNVRPVNHGIRRVLVLEIWDGLERTCAHRCLKPTGDCGYSLNRSQLASMAQMVSVLG